MRSWRLFISLLLGIVLAATFFAGINVAADTAAKQELDKRLSAVAVDFVINTAGFQETRIITSDSKQTGTTGFAQSLSSQNVTQIMSRVRNVEGIENVEPVSRFYGSTRFTTINETFYPLVAGMSENSSIYADIVSALEANETYVWDGSPHISNLHVGDKLAFNLTMYNPQSGQASVLINLTIAGFKALTQQELMIASGQYYGSPYDMGGPSLYFYGDFFVANWEKTFVPLIDEFADLPAGYGPPVSTDILVFINRPAFISPWDVTGSLKNLEALRAQINDEIRIFNLETPSSTLISTLSYYQYLVLGMRFTFSITSFPVFLVAWYMGSTVSDVSFNLRRKEIGLLLTKGFSRRQLLVMFLIEAIMIGVVGGLAGIGLSLALNPVFVRAVGGEFSGTPYIGTDTLIITVIFSLTLTFLASFQPARRASRMATVEALKEYSPMEDTKPYKRLWPWLAFGLGTYKIVILLLGLNLTMVLRDVMFSGNIALIVVLSIATGMDAILLFIGPFLFFWGCAKIFIRGSLKFQELTTRAAKFLGDLGALATKSVQRNPARAASVAFLLASIIFYSVWVSGTLASQQDHGVREIYFQVGADVNVSFKSPQNASALMQRINQNLSDVLAASTLEYQMFGTMGSVRAVDPKNWLAVAYYENDFFSGNDAQKAFELLASNNQSIILELGYAQYVKKKLNDTVSIDFFGTLSKETWEFRIVGFFGLPVPSQTYPSPFGETSYYPSQYWSLIPDSLFKQMDSETTERASASMLIKLKDGADGEAVAERIRDNFSVEVNQVSSVAERLKAQQSDIMQTGQFNLLRLGIIFVVLASSVGTALVTLVSLRERSRETAMMSVRGLSFSQLLTMLLTENLTVVTFAVLLGGVVGLIATNGTVASSNAASLGASVNWHMVFPFETTVTILFSIALVFAATIIPVVYTAKRSGSKLERTVREV